MSEVTPAKGRLLEAGQLVVFLLADDEYALPIESVQEIIRYTEPRAVSADAPWIVGVISLRGKIIPVCDLGLRLGHQAHSGENAKIVIVDSPTGIAGIVVDDVAEVLTTDAEHLDAVPSVAIDFMAGIAQVGARLVVVLDPTLLFGDLALSVAGAALDT